MPAKCCVVSCSNRHDKGTDNKAASALLKSVVDWYEKNNGSSADLSNMWRQAVEFYLRGGDTDTAASSLEELLMVLIMLISIRKRPSKSTRNYCHLKTDYKLRNRRLGGSKLDHEY